MDRRQPRYARHSDESYTGADLRHCGADGKHDLRERKLRKQSYPKEYSRWPPALSRVCRSWTYTGISLTLSTDRAPFAAQAGSPVRFTLSQTARCPVLLLA